MLKPFLETLEESILVCDGAMGTQLYAKGVFLNRCFDELNLSNPALVREVHQEYLWAGADILETNTFGANRRKLEPHGLAERVREINLAGARIAKEAAGGRAYVAGSVGPFGVRVEPYGRMGIDQARGEFREQIGALAEAGVDLISLETFSDLNELHAAILAARDVSDLPIIAQMTLQDDGNSVDGTPPESFGPQLAAWGADIIGANCGVGPHAMLECVERLAQTVSCRLAAQPNAGKPRNFEGRNLYLSSPEYFASYARRFVRAGVRIIGGCCGTTPAHIKSIRTAVRAQPALPMEKPVTVHYNGGAEAIPAAPVEKRSGLAEQLLTGRRAALVVEMSPPAGVDARQAISSSGLLKARGVDAICISDAPRGAASMTASALAVLLGQETEIILRLGCGDRSLLTMQSELLGLYAMGIRNLLLATGDPLRIGEFVDATAVLEADPTGVTHLLTRLGLGRDLGGKRIGIPAAFHVGVSVDPAAADPEHEIRSLERKIEAGAHFVVTEPFYHPRLAGAFRERISHLRLPVIACVRPLASYREAELLRNEIAGNSIPDSLVERIRDAGSPEAEHREGIRIATETARALREFVQGIMVAGRVENPAQVLEVLEL